MNTTIYDDTGRSMQTMKVQRLLDKAKMVIAHENRKTQKDIMKSTAGGKSAFRDKKMASAYSTKMSAMGMTGGHMSKTM